MDTERIECPGCKVGLSGALVAKLKAPYLMGMKLRPHPGTKLESRTLTESIDALSRMLVAVAKDLGGSAMVVVDSISTDETGEVDISLMVVEKARAAAQETSKP